MGRIMRHAALSREEPIVLRVKDEVRISHRACRSHLHGYPIFNSTYVAHMQIQRVQIQRYKCMIYVAARYNFLVYHLNVYLNAFRWRPSPICVCIYLRYIVVFAWSLSWLFCARSTLFLCSFFFSPHDSKLIVTSPRYIGRVTKGTCIGTDKISKVISRL